MSHFAKIENNKVVNVIVAEQEHIDTLDGEWVQTSYNTIQGKHKQGGIPLRGNYAGIGFDYDRVNDIFLPPKPYESFTVDVKTASWKAPTDMPLDGQLFLWNETTLSWDISENRDGGLKLK